MPCVRTAAARRLSSARNAPVAIMLAGACAAVALMGCSALGPGDALDRQRHLLADERFAVAPGADAPAVQMLAVSDEMRVFLAQEFDRQRNHILSFERLMRAMALNGLFTRNFAQDITHTAAETFAERLGNCLSYTSLFVAMAREVGMDAQFQVVDVPPMWDADARYLIRYKHVNVLIRDVRLRDGRIQDLTVDFNTIEPSPAYRRHVISDQDATALFHANLAIDHLREGDTPNAFLQLRRALRLAPHNPDLWINLGALYATTDRPALAAEAYDRALAYDARDRSALTGLAASHERLGNASLAAEYRERARRYRDRNPYYHFGVALARYDEGRYAEALSTIGTAIHLHGRDGRFHYLEAMAYEQLGNPDASRSSLRRAEQLGNYGDLKARYAKNPKLGTGQAPSSSSTG